MEIRYIERLTLLALFVCAVASTHAHRRHHSRHPVCVLTTRGIQDTLNNPCSQGNGHISRHPMEPSNICFLKKGRIVTSLQAMLATLNQTYEFNPQDMDLLFDISLDLPTRLDSYTTTNYVNVMRQYYRELACMTIAMDRSYASVHGRPRQQYACNIVTRHVGPMLCVDTDDELEPLPRDCSDWFGLDSSLLDFYAHWTVRYFEQFLSSLSPSCRVTLRG